MQYGNLYGSDVISVNLYWKRRKIIVVEIRVLTSKVNHGKNNQDSRVKYDKSYLHLKAAYG